MEHENKTQSIIHACLESILHHKEFSGETSKIYDTMAHNWRYDLKTTTAM